MSKFAKLMTKAKESNEFSESKVRNKVAIQIANILKDKKITQTEFADAVGVSAAYISKVLSGNENFSVKTLVKLTRALDADIDIQVRPRGNQCSADNMNDGSGLQPSDSQHDTDTHSVVHHHLVG